MLLGRNQCYWAGTNVTGQEPMLLDRNQCYWTGTDVFLVGTYVTGYFQVGYLYPILLDFVPRSHTLGGVYRPSMRLGSMLLDISWCDFMV